jgi:hypothetical protein
MDTLKVREDIIVSISASPLLAVPGPAESILPPAAPHPITSPATTIASRVVFMMSTGVKGRSESGKPPVSLYPHFTTIQAESRPSIYLLNIPVIRG